MQKRILVVEDEAAIRDMVAFALRKADMHPVPAGDARAAQHAIADRQGRLVLPEELCRKIGLKDEVALVGNRGRFEIWNLQRWKRAHEEETATYQHVANVIGL